MQVEEFAHINGWEACPDEEPSTEKPSSKTSSRVSTPVTEIVDSKKGEQEPVKKEGKEATPEKKEDKQQKSEPMETDKDEAGKVGVLPIMAWFSKRKEISVEDSARKSNNWLDQWQSGKLGTGSRV